MNEVQMKKRTKDFAKDIISLVRQIPNNREGRLIGDQLFRSSTSVAANYRAACRARSRDEFVSKLAIVIEETDESAFWLEFIIDEQLMEKSKVAPLSQEADELTAIFVASQRTARRNRD